MVTYRVYRPQVVQHCFMESRLGVPNLVLNSSFCALIYISYEIRFLWCAHIIPPNGDLME